MSKQRTHPLLWIGLTAFFIFSLFLIVNAYTKVRIPTASHPTELYANTLQDDLRMTLKQAIEQGKESIVMIIYALSDHHIISILREKAEEGLDVTVVCDAKASRNAIKRLGKKVKVIPRNPRGIMHMKILVVDGVKTWIGSANMTTESLRLHGNLIMGIYSPKLAKTIIDKAKEMDSTMPHQDFQVGDQTVELWLLPDDAVAVERLKEMIASAQKTIRVAMFTWTRRDLAQSIIDAKTRGVTVEVFLDRYSGRGASKHVVEMLYKAHVPISLSEGSALLHYKMMVIDDQILVNGSANWTKAAFTINNDCFIILRNLNPSQKKMIETLWEVIRYESQPFEG